MGVSPEKVLIQFSLTDEQKQSIHGMKYCDSPSANRVIARAVESVLEEGVFVTRGRETFADTAIKREVWKRVFSNKRAKRAHRECSHHYTHYAVSYVVGAVRRGWAVV
jgi:hypothetical protein